MSSFSVVADPFAAVKARCPFVAGDHRNGHDPGAPLGQALAGGVQQLPADTDAAGAAVHHEGFQNADLVAPLPRVPNAAAWLGLLPYEPDNGFDDRYVQVSTMFGGAAVIRGNLTPECATAVLGVLEALGKKQGPEDDRTEGKRFHDALQLA